MGWQDAPAVAATPSWQSAPEVGATAAPAAGANPAADQGNWQNYAAGMGKFVSDTGTGAKQLLDDLAASAQDKLKDTSVGRGIDWLNSSLGLASPADIQAKGRQDIQETRRLDAPLMATKAGQAGYASGALSTIPMLPATSTYSGAAALGAGLGAVEPATSWNERAKNAALGGMSSVGGQAVANGLSRIINPQTAPAAQALLDAGITPTPGQILGGGYKRAEEAATSIPVLGDFIKRAQNRGIQELNDAIANRALAPTGKTLPADKAGRDAIDYVGSELGSAYDALVPKLGIQSDTQLGNDLRQLHQWVNSGAMGDQEVNQFNKLLANRVVNRFGGQNSITGQTFKDMDADLGKMASDYLRDPSADKRQLGNAIGEIQSSLRDALVRSNPTHADQLNSLNGGWAVFKRMQRAASSTGADAGVFTPTQLQAAVKGLDRSKDKAAFARGDALLQDLSDPAKELMAPKLADSGTPYRLLAEGIAAGGLGAHALPAISTVVNPWTIGGALSVPALYSQPGQKLAATLLTKRPDFAGPLATAVQAAGRPLAVTAPALTYASQQ
jgi:hypothetical protein